MWQVSELSHKLGSAEGNCRSMEEELSRLQNQNVHLGKGKSERDVEANELRAKLRSADEKVFHFTPIRKTQQLMLLAYCTICSCCLLFDACLGSCRSMVQHQVEAAQKQPIDGHLLWLRHCIQHCPATHVHATSLTHGSWTSRTQAVEALAFTSATRQLCRSLQSYQGQQNQQDSKGIDTASFYTYQQPSQVALYS